MKSFFKYFLVAIIVTTLLPLSSCKKGANDPFLSLRSRSSRLEGTWKFSTQTYNVTQISGNTNTTRDYTYDGNRIKLVKVTKIGNSAAVTDTSSYAYSETMEITKDNTFKETIIQSGVTYLIEGNWAFLGADKAADLKKKEAVVLHFTKYTFGPTVSTSGNTDNPSTWVLEELSNKTMVISKAESDIQDATHSSITKGTVTYIQ